MRWFLILTFAASTCLAASPPGAPPPAPDSRGQVQGLIQNSPFTRRLNTEGSIFLTGLARVDDKAVATVLDTTTEETYLVTESPNAQGWRLVAISPETEIGEVSIKIQINGGEVVDVRYSADVIKPQQNYGTLKRDSRGRAIPPQRIIDKFKKLNKDQWRRYHEWRATMVARDSDLDKSPRRFPIIEKAVDNILQGKEPPKQ